MMFPLTCFCLEANAAQGLDDYRLRENLTERVLSSISGENQKIDISAEKIKVLQIEPVLIGDIKLYASKLAIVEPDGRLNEMIIVTDATGSYQFTNVREVKNGDEAVLSQVPSITKMTLPEGLAKTIAKGKGEHEVVFISDPFCPFCRKAFAYLINKVDDIKDFKAVHYPLPMHPGAEAAAWVMSEAEDQNMTPLQVMRFAYTQLILPAQKDEKVNLETLQKEVVKQFAMAFPALIGDSTPDAFFKHVKEKWSDKIEKDMQQLTNIDITATPAILIDGQMIKGLDTKQIDKLLGKSKD